MIWNHMTALEKMSMRRIVWEGNRDPLAYTWRNAKYTELNVIQSLWTSCYFEMKHKSIFPCRLWAVNNGRNEDGAKCNSSKWKKDHNAILWLPHICQRDSAVMVLFFLFFFYTQTLFESHGRQTMLPKYTLGLVLCRSHGALYWVWAMTTEYCKRVGKGEQVTVPQRAWFTGSDSRNQQYRTQVNYPTRPDILFCYYNMCRDTTKEHEKDNILIR